LQQGAGATGTNQKTYLIRLLEGRKYSGLKNDQQTAVGDPSGFGEQYFQVRAREGRIYQDREVALLPRVEPNDPNKKEWKVRSRSASRLHRYLARKKKPLSVLEVGCGNGWLSALLAQTKDSTVTGVDIHQVELEQAKRVFGNRQNLQFRYGSLEIFDARECSFDIIVFAASIQYFPNLPAVLQTALELLTPEGEIHILDTPFYGEGEVEGARQRSRAYFQKLGEEAMAAYYFHHSYPQLQSFRVEYRVDPRSLRNRIWKRDPFPWLCIRKTP